MFDKFPKINYNFNGKEVEVTDIFRNVKVDFTNFSDYKIVQQTNSRPDQTAATVYDDPNKFWLMFLTNDVKNPFVEWQETAGGQYGIDKTVYDTMVYQFANSSAYRPTNAEYYSSNTTDRYLGVDFSGIQANDIITFEKGDGPLRLKCFGAGQVKTTDSVCGAPHYGQSIIPDNFYNRNGVTHISAGGNVTAVLDSVGRIWAWGEDIGLDNAAGINFAYGPDLYFSDQTGYTTLNTTKNKILASKGNQLYCFGNGCTGTFPQTLNENIKKIAFLKGNTYGGVILYNNSKIELINGLTATIGITGFYLSGNIIGVTYQGTTFTDITCTEDACFGLITHELNQQCFKSGVDAEPGIYLYQETNEYNSSILEFNFLNTKCGYTPNTLNHHISLQMDGRLIETNGVIDKNIYTTKDYKNHIYIRNTNHWLTAVRNEKLGITTGVDLTGVSPWNSTVPIGPNQDQWGYFNTGTAITPRHIITAAHYISGEGIAGFVAGDTIKFVTNNNQVITRTIVNKVRRSDLDIEICLLNEDLPPSITPVKLLNEDFHDYFPNSMRTLGYKNTYLPSLWIDVQEESLIGLLVYMKYYDSFLNQAFFRSHGPDPNITTINNIRRFYGKNVVSGDSSGPYFFIINNQLVMLGMFWGWGGGVSLAAYKKVINDMITTLGGGHTVSYIDLSSFSKQTEVDLKLIKKIEGGNNNLLVMDNKFVRMGTFNAQTVCSDIVIDSSARSIKGYGDNSKGQLNFPQKTNYVSMSAGKYHTAITDIHGNLNVYGQIFTNSGGCTGTTVYTAATAAYGSYGTKISSGDNHIVALESGKNVKYTGRIVKLDSAMKRIYVRGISGPPVYIKDPGGTQVIITKSDGLGIKRTIQHQLRSIDLYKNTPIYVRDQGFVINMSDNSGQQWNNIFIDNYQNSENDVRFITPVKLQKESFISGLKVLDFTKLYSLQNTIEPLLTSETKINIKMSEL